MRVGQRCEGLEQRALMKAGSSWNLSCTVLMGAVSFAGSLNSASRSSCSSRLSPIKASPPGDSPAPALPLPEAAGMAPASQGGLPSPPIVYDAPATSKVSTKFAHCHLQIKIFAQWRLLSVWWWW